MDQYTQPRKTLKKYLFIYTYLYIKKVKKHTNLTIKYRKIIQKARHDTIKDLNYAVERFFTKRQIT